MKIINPSNSGGNIIETWQGEKFSSTKQMSHVLGEEFAHLIQGNNYGFGYMETGHGMNGKHDLTTMWSEFKGKRCVLL